MAALVALIHTSPSMVPVFKDLTKDLLPGVEVFNMVDESLLRDIIREGKLVPATARRLVGHVQAAADAGASHILVTCSSMGRATEAAATMVGATVLRVDEAMTAKAIELGTKIGVIATLPSTLEPTAALIRQRATAEGKRVEVVTRVVEGAFAAVMSGDGVKHDALVGDAVKKLSGEVDVIVLAQASMARVVDAIPADQRPKPILSSPRLAIEKLASVMKGVAPSKAVEVPVTCDGSR